MENSKVYVKWNDAALVTGYNNKDAESVGLVEIETVGILIEERATYIKIALSSTATEDEFGEILSIPKCQIVDIDVLGYAHGYKFLYS